MPALSGSGAGDATPALRRAVRERDQGRCQFPGVATPAVPTSTTSSPGPKAARRACGI
jgi:hypothetical protein